MMLKTGHRNSIYLCSLTAVLCLCGCGVGSKSSVPATTAEQAKAAAGGPIPPEVNAAMQAKYGSPEKSGAQQISNAGAAYQNAKAAGQVKPGAGPQ